MTKYTKEEDIILLHVYRFGFVGLLGVPNYRQLRSLFGDIRTVKSYNTRVGYFKSLAERHILSNASPMTRETYAWGSLLAPATLSAEVNKVITAAREIRLTPPPVTESDADVAARIGLSELAVNYLRR